MEQSESSGSLVIVGTGICAFSQITAEARAHIEQSEKVLYLIADPAMESWILKCNPTAESLDGFYQPGKDRLTTYHEMVERVLSCVHEGLNVCVADYGHPGFFAYPSHEVIRRASLEGFTAKMLPGVSSVDCLFADLGIDPGSHGCQIFEATDFLVYKRKFDPYCSLILLQIGLIGEMGYKASNDVWNVNNLRVLAEVLSEHYGTSHEVVVYQAAHYSICDPIITTVPLTNLPEAKTITPISTLYVPSRAPATPDIDMLNRLGIPLPHLRKK
ncbi:MAG TPA: SAM-dependent methyltransferase [Ktedonobacteraceae bacterium]|nr:SAM-dependent methyltransferase [Ktedonobacteraceae bacterium]